MYNLCISLYVMLNKELKTEHTYTYTHMYVHFLLKSNPQFKMTNLKVGKYELAGGGGKLNAEERGKGSWRGSQVSG